MATRGPSVEIIRPSGPISDFSKTKVVGRMRRLGLDTVRAAAKYPSAQTAYRRTGTLGRGWTSSGPRLSGKDLVVDVGNVTEYTGRVMGLKTEDPRQLQLFRRLGWRSIETIGEEEVRKALPDITKALQG